MKNFTIALILMFSFSVFANAQERRLSRADSLKIYRGGEFYPVQNYPVKFSKNKRPKNVIFLIGDGMGLAQLYAGMTANGGRLFIDNFKNIGFSKTYSADNYVTDSAAGGTALASGTRTNNDYLGVDTDKDAIVNIRELAEKMGKTTGVVSTSAVTHATPGSFVAHQPGRSMYEEIANDFVNSDIDVFIGGGLDHFTKRKDKRDLTNDLKNNGFQVLTDINKIANVTSGKLAGLTAPEHNGRASERGNMLPIATNTAINILKNNKKGFFLMVEGSHIDWGGHDNDVNYIVEEVLDFDRTIAVALEFAARNRETLIVITADHETGGLALNGGSLETGMVRAAFTTGGHTGILVPIYAFGPGAEYFRGFMHNIDIPKLIISLLKQPIRYKLKLKY